MEQKDHTLKQKPCFDLRVWWTNGLMLIIVFLYLRFSDYVAVTESQEGFLVQEGGLKGFDIYDIFPQKEILSILF